jgi:hypothetical protein
MRGEDLPTTLPVSSPGTTHSTAKQQERSRIIRTPHGLKHKKTKPQALSCLEVRNRLVLSKWGRNWWEIALLVPPGSVRRGPDGFPRNRGMGLRTRGPLGGEKRSDGFQMNENYGLGKTAYSRTLWGTLAGNMAVIGGRSLCFLETYYVCVLKC